jgi:Flp pilus assembly protein protease CpaA
LFFAKLIERDRQAEFDPSFAPAYFTPWNVMVHSAVTGLMIGVSYVAILLITSQPLGSAVTAWRNEGALAFLQHPQTANIVWFFCAVSAGAYTFFRSFVRSALDIAEPQTAPASEPEQAIPV